METFVLMTCPRSLSSTSFKPQLTSLQPSQPRQAHDFVTSAFQILDLLNASNTTLRRIQRHYSFAQD